jgi:cyclin B
MAALVARASRRLQGEDAENPARAAKPERKRAAFSDLTNLGAASAAELGAKQPSKPASKKVEKEEIPARPNTATGLTKTTASEGNPSSVASSLSPGGPWVANLSAIDRPDVDNTQSVAEYAADIFCYLRERETVVRLKDDYMQSQQDVTEKMRMILVDWLVEVHWKFKLSPDTLFLTINLLDRYLSQVSVRRTKLQLVGVTCMLLASKHEEIYPPEIKDFVHVTDKAYTKQDILDMEVSALNVLNFQLTAPSPLGFLHRMVKVQECTPEHVSLCQYLLELTLCHYRSIRHLPSHLAASALFLANKIMKISPAWSPKLQEETQYQESQIKSCAKEMCALLQAAEKASLQAVRKKFSQSQFHRVAKMVA